MKNSMAYGISVDKLYICRPIYRLKLRFSDFFYFFKNVSEHIKSGYNADTPML